MQKDITQTSAGRYEARYQGVLIATESTEAAAREKLNEYRYDLERGRVRTDDAALAIACEIDRIVAEEGLTLGCAAPQQARGDLVVTPKGDEPGHTWVEYALGCAELSLENGGAGLFADGYELLSFVYGEAGPDPRDMTVAQSLAVVRDVARLLSHPTVRQALGLA